MIFKSLILSLIAGSVSLTIAYLFIRKSIVPPSKKNLVEWENQDQETNLIKNNNKNTVVENNRLSILFAILVPLSFVSIIIYVVLATFSNSVPPIEPGAGAALIGGTAVLLLIGAAIFRNARSSLANASSYIIQGFVFAFKVMGVVIPIAGFFFLGSDNHFATIFGLENGSDHPAFLFDLVQAAQEVIPNSAFLAGFGILIIGMISGLDGSGFSALPLIGGLADALGPSAGVDTATLASIGQLGAIWVGGGTLIAWSPIIAIAGFAKIPVMDLVRRSFLPVVVGLLIATTFGLLFL